MDSPHVCCSFITRSPMARSWARSLPAAGPLRVHCVSAVGLLFEQSTVISMCVADLRLTVRPMFVCAWCSKDQHRAQSWFAYCPVVVRSLSYRSSPPVYSQYTACSPRISPDLIKFFGISESSGYGRARGQPDLRHAAATYCMTLNVKILTNDHSYL